MVLRVILSVWVIVTAAFASVVVWRAFVSDLTTPDYLGGMACVCV